MLAALCEVLVGTTGFVVLSLVGRRDREPKDTTCMVVGLGVWAAIAGLVWLAVVCYAAHKRVDRGVVVDPFAVPAAQVDVGIVDRTTAPGSAPTERPERAQSRRRPP